MALLTWLTSWKIAGITFGFCLLSIVTVLGIGASSLSIKLEESSFCDQRLKLIGDFVEGIRTIKAFGWEVKCEKKLAYVRKN